MKRNMITVLFFLIIIYCVFLQVFQMTFIRNRQTADQEIELKFRALTETKVSAITLTENPFINFTTRESKLKPFTLKKLNRSSRLEEGTEVKPIAAPIGGGDRDDVRESLETLNVRMKKLEDLIIGLRRADEDNEVTMKKRNDMEPPKQQHQQQHIVLSQNVTDARSRANLVSRLNQVLAVKSRLKVADKSRLKVANPVKSDKPDTSPFKLESINETCRPKDLIGFSSCLDKLVWMKNMWKSDPCYGEWGVNGNECSMLEYLADIEHHCPSVNINTTSYIHNLKEKKTFDRAVLRHELNGLLEKLSHMKSMLWIRNRIERMTDKWLYGVDQLVERRKNLNTVDSYRKQNILLVIGVLTDAGGEKFADNAFHGGPLGELVQWSDILASLYLAGHDITVCTSTQDLKKYLEEYIRGSHNCPSKSDPYDVIFADIMGLKKLNKAVKFGHLLNCRMRIVDSFGTEPEYNYAPYSKSKSHNMEWGGLNLPTKQFYTMFPHTPDNTFLGFVIEEYSDKSKRKESMKNNTAVVYGKVDMFWQGREPYIRGIHDGGMEIHGTVDTGGELPHVPSYVINHGLLPGNQLQELLRFSRVFVGLGFPFEGPAPLEAIANGMIYLNPIIQESSPLAHKAKAFFKNKPTSRKLRTQHDYASTFIGKPHVIDVRITDVAHVKQVINDIINSPQVEPYLPHEFTCFGMMERLSILLEKQDFCTSKPTWPPISELKLKLSNEVDDCVETCRKSSLICERDYFPHINNWQVFDDIGIKCASQQVPDGANGEIDYPAIDQTNGCKLQNTQLLFSCAGRYTNMRRVCPCREYIPGQIALCKSCLQH